MHAIADRTNAVSPELFGDLSPDAPARGMNSLTPVLATPATVAFAVTMAGFAAGVYVGYANGGSTRPKER
ncbi:hypothetical protein ACFWNK_35515 [Streptomyces sp. NPDC058417]|uniref:hypothetical protein n=1 Tax=unclassified Streptomyces TaxID=2593676 RepID=UPI00365EC12C